MSKSPMKDQPLWTRFVYAVVRWSIKQFSNVMLKQATSKGYRPVIPMVEITYDPNSTSLIFRISDYGGFLREAGLETQPAPGTIQ